MEWVILIIIAIAFLFWLHSKQKRPKSKKMNRDIETIRQCAQRLVDIINESKELARTSNNPETKISRLQLAQDKLIELKKMARQYSFLKLLTLNEFEAELNEIALKIQKNGETEKTFRTYNINSKELYEDNSDIIKGHQFVATMQLRTPLKYLEMHGQILDLKSEPPQVPEAHGVWFPVTKTWKELGINGLKELPESTMASDIGQVPESGGEYLEFLKAFRRIVESDKSFDTKCQELLDLPKKSDKFAEYFNKHAKLQPDKLPKFLYELRIRELVEYEREESLAYAMMISEIVPNVKKLATLASRYNVAHNGAGGYGLLAAKQSKNCQTVTEFLHKLYLDRYIEISEQLIQKANEIAEKRKTTATKINAWLKVKNTISTSTTEFKYELPGLCQAVEVLENKIDDEIKKYNK